MKHLLIYCAAAVLLAGLSACSNERELSDNAPENAVRINATIGESYITSRSNPIGSTEEQASFNEGDVIRLYDKTNHIYADYKKEANSWIAEKNQYIPWDGEKMSFSATYGSEKQILNQRNMANLCLADYMIANIDNAEKKDGALNLVMQRQKARLIINIIDIKNQFTQKKDDYFNIIDGNRNGMVIYPHAQGDGSKGTIYTCILRPDSAYSLSTFLDNKSLTLDLKLKMSASMSYTCNVVVGHDKIEVVNVEVADWSNSSILPDGNFVKQNPYIIDETNHILTLKLKDVLTKDLLDKTLGSGNSIKIKGVCSSVDFLDTLKTWIASHPQAKNFDFIDLKTDVQRLDDYFANNESLLSVKLPASVTSLNNTFNNCTNLDFTSMNLDNIQEVFGKAFNNCPKLVNLTLPNVYLFDPLAVSNNPNLEVCKLPNLSLFERPLGGNIFSDLPKLKELWLTNPNDFRPKPYICDPEVSIHTTLYLNVIRETTESIDFTSTNPVWKGVSWKAIHFVDDKGNIVK